MVSFWSHDHNLISCTSIAGANANIDVINVAAATRHFPTSLRLDSLYAVFRKRLISFLRFDRGDDDPKLELIVDLMADVTFKFLLFDLLDRSSLVVFFFLLLSFPLLNDIDK